VLFDEKCCLRSYDMLIVNNTIHLKCSKSDINSLMLRIFIYFYDKGYIFKLIFETQNFTFIVLFIYLINQEIFKCVQYIVATNHYFCSYFSRRLLCFNAKEFCLNFLIIISSVFIIISKVSLKNVNFDYYHEWVK